MDESDEVLRSAGYLLMKAGHHIGMEFDAALDTLGLTGREFLVLSFVRAAHGLSQQELSERLNLDPTLVVGLVDGLEGRHLMRRAKDPADRRRNLLSATDEGLAVHEEAVAAAGRAEDTFLAPLGAGAREDLRGALREIMAPRLVWLQD